MFATLLLVALPVLLALSMLRHQRIQCAPAALRIPNAAEMLPRARSGRGTHCTARRRGKGILEQLSQVFVRGRGRISRSDQPVACQHAARHGISFAR